MRLLEPGSEVGGFVIGECLQSGHATQLYLVHCAEGRPDPGYPLVMKVPRLVSADARPQGEEPDAMPDALQGADAPGVLHIEVEHQILQALGGPHVPRLLAAGEFEQQPWLVMEYIAGTHLQQRLDQPALPAIEDVLSLGITLALAVHSLHQQQTVHLGLRPDRVRITGENRLVLLGYGLACHTHYPDLRAGASALDLGASAWMAPEQVLGLRGDLRSDVYALGAILYQLLTHELPHGMPDTEAGLRRRLWAEPPPPRYWRSDIPAWLQEVLLRCLRPEPAQRYPSAAHLAFDLRHPQQVRVTALGHALRPAAVWTGWRRRLRALRLQPRPLPVLQRLIADVPIVLLAVPQADTPAETLYALRRAALRALGQRPGARLACVTVIPPGDSGMLRRQLAQLQLWAQSLEGPAYQTSCHVLAAPDVATALLDWAQLNRVSLIVLGASEPGLSPEASMASVPGRVMLQAPCSVMLVRRTGAPETTG